MTTDDELIEAMLVAMYDDGRPGVVDSMRAVLAVVREHDGALRVTPVPMLPDDAHAAALAAKDAEIEALKLSLVRAAGWTEHDQPLPEDDAILAAFPVGTNRDAGRFATYAEAQRLVSAKRSKGALVDLVNWLLARAERAEAEAAGLRADAGRYRVARAKVCIVGDAFHVINLRPTYVAPDAAIEFDAAIDAARGES